MSKTSCSFHFRPSHRRGKEHLPAKLYMRLIRLRGSVTITTEYAIYPHEWDEAGHCLIFPDDANDPRHQALMEISASMAADLKRLDSIIASFEASGREFSAADVCARFKSAPGGMTVGEYTDLLCGKLDGQGRFNTLKAYRSAVSAFRKFCGGRDIALAEITRALILDYDKWFIKSWRRGNLSMNTISFYLRNLRSIRNQAIRNKIFDAREDRIFHGTHTKIYETGRRAISKEEIKSLALLEISLQEEIEEEKRKWKEEKSGKLLPKPGEAPIDCAAIAGEIMKPTKSMEQLDALNFFMISFYGRGISFTDMAHLRKEDLRDDHIRYIRSKTGRQMEVAVVADMQPLINYFASRQEGSPYLLPILDANRKGIDAWRQTQTALKRYNKLLAELAKRAGIAGKITSHVARHTWATLAKYANYTIEAICEALGHKDVKTTEIYLASFERSVMDELSNRIEELVRTA